MRTMRIGFRPNLAICLGTFIALHLVIIDLVLYYGYTSVFNKLNSLHLNNIDSFYDFFDQNQELRDLVKAGKNGGFMSLTRETLGRVFSVSHSIPSQEGRSDERTISYLGVDVSHSGEVSYIYKRILSRQSFPFSHLVVDIGANDGFLSSNSLNFIQLGWDAVLVEPQARQLSLAKKNGKRFVDPYGDNIQNVHYVEAAMGEKDGTVELAVSDDIVNMESYVSMGDKDTTKRKKFKTIQVRSLCVRTLAETYDIPKKFAVLSIDAEGVGDKVIHQWVDLGYRPAYIIYEHMFNTELWADTTSYLTKAGYRYLTKLGWNHIYELGQVGPLQGSGINTASENTNKMSSVKDAKGSR